MPNASGIWLVKYHHIHPHLSVNVWLHIFLEIIIPFIGDGVASRNRILSKPDTEMIILQDSAAIAVAKKTWTSENWTTGMLECDSQTAKQLRG